MQPNRLLPSEYAWLQTMFQRIPMRQSQLAEIGDFSKFIAQLTTVLEDLLAHRVIRPKHRTSLVRTLRSERLLLEKDGNGNDNGAEIATITAFLERICQLDWEAIRDPGEPYNKDELWGNFRITETEILLALSDAGCEGTYVAEYASLVAGTVVSIALQGLGMPRIFTLELLRVRISEEQWEGTTGLLFEARILNTLSKAIDEGFGILFPDGQAFFILGNPNASYVHECILIAATKGI